MAANHVDRIEPHQGERSLFMQSECANYRVSVLEVAGMFLSSLPSGAVRFVHLLTDLFADLLDRGCVDCGLVKTRSIRSRSGRLPRAGCNGVGVELTDGAG